jgi:hypothetical protein
MSQLRIYWKEKRDVPEKRFVGSWQPEAKPNARGLANKHSPTPPHRFSLLHNIAGRALCPGYFGRLISLTGPLGATLHSFGISRSF